MSTPRTRNQPTLLPTVAPLSRYNENNLTEPNPTTASESDNRQNTSPVANPSSSTVVDDISSVFSTLKLLQIILLSAHRLQAYLAQEP